MVSIHYRSHGDLIIVPACVENARVFRQLIMLLDTGCSNTIVRPQIFEALSVSADQMGKRTTIQTALHKEHGQLFRVTKFEFLDRSFINQELDCHELPDNLEIDGLIGMDILSKYKFTIDPRKKTISTTGVI